MSVGAIYIVSKVRVQKKFIQRELGGSVVVRKLITPQLMRQPLAGNAI